MQEKNRRKTRRATPREDMEGPLYKTSVSIEQRNLLGGLFSTVKNSLGHLANTVHKKRSERYFAIKRGVLYWYEHKQSRKAQNEIPITDIKKLEFDDQSKTVFYIIHKHKCYKLEGKTVESAQQWFRSIELVMSKA